MGQRPRQWDCLLPRMVQRKLYRHYSKSSTLMHFQSTTPVTFPTTSPVTFPSTIQTRQQQLYPSQPVAASVTVESGESTWIVQPGVPQINLMHITVAWHNIQIAGLVKISGVEELFTVLQSRQDARQDIPCYDMPVELADHGLRATNNSVGGTYNVTAIYKPA